MSSFHEQWMDAWDELTGYDEAGILSPIESANLRSDMSTARELINEENEHAERRTGGQIIRDVRCYLRDNFGILVHDKDGNPVGVAH